MDSKQGHNSVEHLHYNSSHLSSDKQVQQVEQVFDGGGECMEHIKLMTRERKAGDVSGWKDQPLLKSIQNELRRPLLLSLIYIYIIDFCLENQDNYHCYYTVNTMYSGLSIPTRDQPSSHHQTLATTPHLSPLNIFSVKLIILSLTTLKIIVN